VVVEVVVFEVLALSAFLQILAVADLWIDPVVDDLGNSSGHLVALIVA